MQGHRPGVQSSGATRGDPVVAARVRGTARAAAGKEPSPMTGRFGLRINPNRVSRKPVTLRLVIILASLLGLFVPVPGLNLTVATLGVLLFSGYILYDTSRLVNGGETSYIRATVALYLDLMNLFFSILNLLSKRD